MSRMLTPMLFALAAMGGGVPPMPERREPEPEGGHEYRLYRIAHDGLWETWTCEPDPLARMWDTAEDAKVEMGADLDWWEEEPNIWMAHRDVVR